MSRQDVSTNLLFEQVLTQLMACQGFLTFLGTKYSDLLHFQHQCILSVLYDKDSIDSIYDYVETSMNPTILLTKTYLTNTLSPNINLSYLPLLETIPMTQEKKLTLKMPLQSPGPHYPTRNSPWTP